MKKSALVVVLSVLVLFAFAQFAFAIFTPSIPSSCSGSAIASTWDSIFRTSSSGITIVNGTSDGRCSNFLAYKINGNLTNVLAGYDLLPYSSNSTYYSAIEGNFSSQFQDILRNATSDNTTALNLSLNPSGLLSYALLGSVNSVAEANTSFSLLFKAENSSWESSGSGSSLVFTFTQSESNSTTITRLNGGVYNKTLNYLTFNKTINLSCTPNWVAVNASCNSTEYKIMWYNDSNKCGSGSGLPSNVSLPCDYDLNGIIGNFNSFSSSNIDLLVYVNGTLGNISRNYSGNGKIDFREEGTTRLTFNHTFDSPLDFRGMSIEVEDSDSKYGYMVIHGINVSKTVWVDKKNSSSDRVCVKTGTGAIGDISDGCNSTNEHLIDCPGVDSGIYCDINGGFFMVSGLPRSIVKEWLKDIGVSFVQVCKTNWSCTAWSDCVSGNKTRICTDKAVCNVSTDKPATSENCTAVNVCNANWNCTDWSPSSCPSNLTQARVCRDLNSCNISTGKPNQTRTCQKTEGTNWQIIGLIAAVIILLIIAVLIIINKLNNGRNDDSNYVNVQGMGPRGPPGPPTGYAPVIVRPIQRPPMMPVQPKPMQPSQPRPMPSGVPFGSY